MGREVPRAARDLIRQRRQGRVDRPDKIRGVADQHPGMAADAALIIIRVLQAAQVYDDSWRLRL